MIQFFMLLSYGIFFYSYFSLIFAAKYFFGIYLAIVYLFVCLLSRGRIAPVFYVPLPFISTADLLIIRFGPVLGCDGETHKLMCKLFVSGAM